MTGFWSCPQSLNYVLHVLREHDVPVLSQRGTEIEVESTDITRLFWDLLQCYSDQDGCDKRLEFFPSLVMLSGDVGPRPKDEIERTAIYIQCSLHLVDDVLRRLRAYKVKVTTLPCCVKCALASFTAVWLRLAL